MVTILDVIGLLSAATLFGSMAFFSAVVAPLIFVKLDAASAGSFVRGLFPWYYLIIALLSAVAAAAMAASRPIEAVIMALVALGAFISRQVLMPRINGHRDRALQGSTQAESRFVRLHRLSVWINTARFPCHSAPCRYVSVQLPSVTRYCR